jgi:deoxyadenosine kinase
MLRDANLMEERDYRTYIELFNNMANFMRKPNLIVHLDVTPEESLERIRMRSRSCESTITLEYLTNLHKAYEEFIQEISRVIPVIRVNWSKFRSAEEMAEMIKKEWQTMQNIHHITWEKEHLK